MSGTNVNANMTWQDILNRVRAERNAEQAMITALQAALAKVQAAAQAGDQNTMQTVANELDQNINLLASAAVQGTPADPNAGGTGGQPQQPVTQPVTNPASQTGTANQPNVNPPNPNPNPAGATTVTREPPT